MARAFLPEPGFGGGQPKRPKYGGRKKGTPNKHTIGLLAKAEAGGIMPLDYMLAIMRDESQPMNCRMEMAIACAPYFHPKMKRVEVTGKENQPIEQMVTLTFD